jgi:hypothetical protein
MGLGYLRETLSGRGGLAYADTWARDSREPGVDVEAGSAGPVTVISAWVAHGVSVAC